MTGAPESAGVLGGGRMGSGIAHALLLAGSRVHVIDADEQSAAAARERVAEAVRQSEKRAPGTVDVDATLARLSAGADHADLADAGLVVEALPEIVALKRSALESVSGVVGADTLLATNTSSLSVSMLAEAVTGPERFLGMHFFNPVPASSLVEVVRGAQTAAAVVDSAVALVGVLGKTPIVVDDSPGFASSRLGVALGLEAIRMVQEGVASAEDIDTAMVLGYKHPVGPLKLTDLVGLDIRMEIASYLHTTLGERFAVPELMREMVERGELGRKSGQGFYSW